MIAKVISGSSLLLKSESDHHEPIFPTCNLSFTSNLTKPIRFRPKFSIKTSSGSFRSAPKAKGVGLTLKAFYMPTLTQETFYDLLGIPESGTLSDIKKAYKQLARKYHPDVSPPESTEEYTKKFIMVKEAYETLSDPQSRAVYDLDLIRGGPHLAFSSRERSNSGEKLEEEWKSGWQSQLNELKWKTAGKDSVGKASWGARMRRRRNSVFDLGL